VTVEYVVLEHEDDVEDDGHDAEHPFDDVETAPREGRLVMTDRLDHILQDREGASCEVQHDVRNRPAHGALPLVVQIDLRINHESFRSYLGHVLDKGD
jgi:hypothetical protein